MPAATFGSPVVDTSVEAAARAEARLNSACQHGTGAQWDRCAGGGAEAAPAQLPQAGPAAVQRDGFEALRGRWQPPMIQLHEPTRFAAAISAFAAAATTAVDRGGANGNCLVVSPKAEDVAAELAADAALAALRAKSPDGGLLCFLRQSG